MHAMISSAAAARAEAVQLRATAAELSLDARRHQRTSRAAVAVSLSACALARDLRLVGLPSPWSSLRWLPPDRELEHVLVAVD